MAVETGEGGGGSAEEDSRVPDVTLGRSSEEIPIAHTSEPTEVAPTTPIQAGGRRTQLKIVREGIQSLSKDVRSFRKSHEESTKTLETHLVSLGKELATHIRSKDLSDHVKSHAAGNKRLEKQIATLRQEMKSLKSEMTKEAARSRAREEIALARVIASVRRAKPTKELRAKPSKSKR